MPSRQIRDLIQEGIIAERAVADAKKAIAALKKADAAARASLVGTDIRQPTIEPAAALMVSMILGTHKPGEALGVILSDAWKHALDSAIARGI